MKILRAPFLVTVVSLSACGQSAHPAPTVCPNSEPVAGSPCGEGLTCRYPTVEPCPAQEYRCVNGQFEQMPLPTCNPPEPPPPEPPPVPVAPPSANPPNPGFAAPSSKA